MINLNTNWLQLTDSEAITADYNINTHYTQNNTVLVINLNTNWLQLTDSEAITESAITADYNINTRTLYTKNNTVPVINLNTNWLQRSFSMFFNTFSGVFKFSAIAIHLSEHQ